MNFEHLISRATKLGVEVEINTTIRGGDIDAVAWAPKGSVFASSGERCVALHWYSGPVSAFCAEFWDLVRDLDPD